MDARDALLFLELDKAGEKAGLMAEEPRRQVQEDPRLRAGWLQFQALRALGWEAAPQPSEKLLREAMLACRREQVTRQLARAAGSEQAAREILLGQDAPSGRLPAWALGLLLLGFVGLAWTAYRRDWLATGRSVPGLGRSSSADASATGAEGVPFEFSTQVSPATAALAVPPPEARSSADLAAGADPNDAHADPASAKQARRLLRRHLQARQGETAKSSRRARKSRKRSEDAAAATLSGTAAAAPLSPAAQARPASAEAAPLSPAAQAEPAGGAAALPTASAYLEAGAKAAQPRRRTRKSRKPSQKAAAAAGLSGTAAVAEPLSPAAQAAPASESPAAAAPAPETGVKASKSKRRARKSRKRSAPLAAEGVSATAAATAPLAASGAPSVPPEAATASLKLSSHSVRPGAAVVLTVESAAAGSLQVELLDAAQKVLKALPRQELLAGPNAFEVKALGADGQPLPAGAYFLRVNTPWFMRLEALQVE